MWVLIYSTERDPGVRLCDSCLRNTIFEQIRRRLYDNYCDCDGARYDEGRFGLRNGIGEGGGFLRLFKGNIRADAPGRTSAEPRGLGDTMVNFTCNATLEDLRSESMSTPTLVCEKEEKKTDKNALQLRASCR